MLKDSATLEAKYNRFIKTVCETEIVYTLKEPRGFAFLYSNQFEDEDGEDALLLCFWSKEAYSNACKQAEWKNHELVEIPLDLFLKNWCIGMKKDYTYAGIECNSHLFCSEKDPIHLAIAILEELIEQDKLGNFVQYYTIYSDYLDNEDLF
ncbi:DUF2750 domain-containing protein [Sphingobacterium bovistauri]|uniref:DUF2750 domain-containing protein n=1 Tax=Sphingobacterium bovistauri TaxID=2781959 RepID=A0ABS7Z4Z6_9SPHI|nr:DUF2750 domain-containing protein [Sphingobacterium bovistauri]MCA5005248.1 DUF2750 domain-containing protein [Sphingobacterium bovistauri]